MFPLNPHYGSGPARCFIGEASLAQCSRTCHSGLKATNNMGLASMYSYGKRYFK